MKKVWLLFVIAGMLAMTSALSQPQESQGRRHGKLTDELKLTDAQQAQFDKTRYETQKKQIELRAKIATARLDLQKLMAADSPDKSSIEKKFNEIASLQAAMKMNRFNAWSENNKMLTPEQQKIWKKALIAAPREMRRRHHNNSSDEMPMHRRW